MLLSPRETNSTSNPGYRGEKTGTPKTQATAVTRKTLDLTITVLAAQSLPLPHSDDSASGFHPYVKVELHVEEPGERDGVPGGHVEAAGREKEGEYKKRGRTRRGRDPDFGPAGEPLAFRAVPGVVEELSFVRLTVRDDELGRDELSCWACVRLDRLRDGYRFVHMLDRKGRQTEGVLLVKVEKRLV